MNAANPPQTVIDQTVGPLVAGILIEQLLLGSLCSQSVSYCTNRFRGDNVFNKAVVITLILLNLFQGGLDW
jgi:hypothetical protein